MKSNSYGLRIALVLFLTPGPLIFAQNIDAEVARLERAAGAASSVSARYTALAAVARLYQLAGDMENAAQAWQNAASVDKNNLSALVEAAFCLTAMGDFDQASADIRRVLIAGADAAGTVKARYLAAGIEAFRRSDTAPLASLLSDTAYDRYKPSIYYTIWKIAGDAAFRNRLLAEYPASPEALAVKDGKEISAFPSALWLFIPAPGGASPAAAPQRLLLQAGLFSDKENAENLAKRIKQAGFDAEASVRTVNGKSYWAVLIPAGENTNKTISQLKAKGFETFPVR